MKTIYVYIYQTLPVEIERGLSLAIRSPAASPKTRV